MQQRSIPGVSPVKIAIRRQPPAATATTEQSTTDADREYSAGSAHVAVDPPSATTSSSATSSASGPHVVLLTEVLSSLSLADLALHAGQFGEVVSLGWHRVTRSGSERKSAWVKFEVLEEAEEFCTKRGNIFHGQAVNGIRTLLREPAAETPPSVLQAYQPEPHHAMNSDEPPRSLTPTACSFVVTAMASSSPLPPVATSAPLSTTPLAAGEEVKTTESNKPQVAPVVIEAAVQSTLPPQAEGNIGGGLNSNPPQSESAAPSGPPALPLMAGYRECRACTARLQDPSQLPLWVAALSKPGVDNDGYFVFFQMHGAWKSSVGTKGKDEFYALVRQLEALQLLVRGGGPFCQWLPFLPAVDVIPALRFSWLKEHPSPQNLTELVLETVFELSPAKRCSADDIVRACLAKLPLLPSSSWSMLLTEKVAQLMEIGFLCNPNPDVGVHIAKGALSCRPRADRLCDALYRAIPSRKSPDEPFRLDALQNALKLFIAKNESLRNLLVEYCIGRWFLIPSRDGVDLYKWNPPESKNDLLARAKETDESKWKKKKGAYADRFIMAAFEAADRQPDGDFVVSVQLDQVHQLSIILGSSMGVSKEEIDNVLLEMFFRKDYVVTPTGRVHWVPPSTRSPVTDFESVDADSAAYLRVFDALVGAWGSWFSMQKIVPAWALLEGTVQRKEQLLKEWHVKGLIELIAGDLYNWNLRVRQVPGPRASTAEAVSTQGNEDLDGVAETATNSTLPIVECEDLTTSPQRSSPDPNLREASLSGEALSAKLPDGKVAALGNVGEDFPSHPKPVAVSTSNSAEPPLWDLSLCGSEPSAVLLTVLSVMALLPWAVDLIDCNSFRKQITSFLPHLGKNAGDNLIEQLMAIGRLSPVPLRPGQVRWVTRPGETSPVGCCYQAGWLPRHAPQLTESSLAAILRVVPESRNGLNIGALQAAVKLVFRMTPKIFKKSLTKFSHVFSYGRGWFGRLPDVLREPLWKIPSDLLVIVDGSRPAALSSLRLPQPTNDEANDSDDDNSDDGPPPVTQNVTRILDTRVSGGDLHHLARRPIPIHVERYLYPRSYGKRRGISPSGRSSDLDLPPLWDLSQCTEAEPDESILRVISVLALLPPSDSDLIDPQQFIALLKIVFPKQRYSAWERNAPVDQLVTLGRITSAPQNSSRARARWITGPGESSPVGCCYKAGWLTFPPTLTELSFAAIFRLTPGFRNGFRFGCLRKLVRHTCHLNKKTLKQVLPQFTHVLQLCDTDCRWIGPLPAALRAPLWRIPSDLAAIAGASLTSPSAPSQQPAVEVRYENDDDMSDGSSSAEEGHSPKQGQTAQPSAIQPTKPTDEAKPSGSDDEEEEGEDEDTPDCADELELRLQKLRMAIALEARAESGFLLKEVSFLWERMIQTKTKWRKEIIEKLIQTGRLKVLRPDSMYCTWEPWSEILQAKQHLPRCLLPPRILTKEPTAEAVLHVMRVTKHPKDGTFHSLVHVAQIWIRLFGASGCGRGKCLKGRLEKLLTGMPQFVERLPKGLWRLRDFRPNVGDANKQSIPNAKLPQDVPHPQATKTKVGETAAGSSGAEAQSRPPPRAESAELFPNQERLPPCLIDAAEEPEYQRPAVTTTAPQTRTRSTKCHYCSKFVVDRLWRPTEFEEDDGSCSIRYCRQSLTNKCVVVYCSEACEELDWGESHQVECPCLH